MSYLNRAEAIKRHENYLSFQKEKQEEKALYSEHYSDRMLGRELLKGGNTTISTNVFFQEKATRLIVLVFGAFWSSKSRNVINKLMKLCEGKSEVLRVVFLSSDRSKSEFDRVCDSFASNESFASVPYNRRDIKGKLAQRFHVDESRLPKLVLIDCKANGNVLTHDAGAAFESGENPLNIWISMSCDKTPINNEVRDDVIDKKQGALQRARELLTKSSESKQEMNLETLMQSLNAEFGEQVVLSVRADVMKMFEVYKTGKAIPTITQKPVSSTMTTKPPHQQQSTGGEGRPARWADAVFGNQLMDMSGRRLKPSNMLAGKRVVLVFFGGRWCKKCNEVAPRLKRFVNSVSTKGVSFVFVSHDRDEVSCSKFWKGSLATGLCVPFEDRYRKGRLDGFFKVMRVPRLVALNGGNGEVLKNDVLADVLQLKNDGEDAAIEMWLGRKLKNI